MEYNELKSYIDKKMSLLQIATESKKSYSSVIYWVSTYGFNSNFSNFKVGVVQKQPLEEAIRYCQHCQTYKKVEEFKYKKRNIRHCKQCVRDQQVKRTRQFKLDCIDYKGGKCQKCGYKKCQAAIEFHHRIPEQKDFSINTNLNRRNIDDRIKKELDKCDILCANCHREEHWM